MKILYQLIITKKFSNYKCYNRQKMSFKIPDRWLNYKPVGITISGTRIVAFKCPLNWENNPANVEEKDRFSPEDLMQVLPEVGLIIDLTNTKRYYNPDVFTSKGIEYFKLFVEGHNIPSAANRKIFQKVIQRFLDENQENDKLVGVHCTHGVNRTGFMICDYLIRNCNWKAEDAISKFDTARGHRIERSNYIDHLNQLKRSFVDIYQISKNTLNSKGTQSYDGHWISDQDINKSKSKSFNKNPSLSGVVRVDESNLIPDGKGGYFVHIKSSDIIKDNSNSTNVNNYNNYGYYRNDGRNRRNFSSRDGGSDDTGKRPPNRRNQEDLGNARKRFQKDF